MTEIDRRAMLAEARDEVTRADFKASILLAALSLTVGVVGAQIAAGGWSPEDLAEPWRVLWWIGVGLSLLGAAFVGWVVYPKTRNLDPGAPVTYFHEIAQLASADVLDEALETQSEEQRVLKQLFAISKIADKKYLALSRGMRALTASLLVLLIAVIGGH